MVAVRALDRHPAAFQAQHARYSRLVTWALVASATAHLLYLVAGPGPTPRPYRLPRSPRPPTLWVLGPRLQSALPPLPPAVDRVAPPRLETAPPALPALPAELDGDTEPPIVFTPLVSTPWTPMRAVRTTGDGHTPFQAFTTDPRPIRRIMPRYPELARMAHAEGHVAVQVDIDAGGRVMRAVIVRSDTIRALERAALDAARQWLFQPARQRELAVPARYIIRFRFTID